MTYSDWDGSCGIVPLIKIEGAWKVFLIQHHNYEDYWTFPKGRVETGETPKVTAVRELKEETGLDVQRFLHNEPILEEFYWFNNGERQFKRVLFFLAEVKGTICLQDPDISNGDWFTLSKAISKISHPEGKETLRKVEQILQSIL